MATVSLPRAADYLEALQHPASCFADPSLAGGYVEQSPLGLPRAMSGNVATVFRVEGSDSRLWAVRCFVRSAPDLVTRYEAIAAHLARVDAPWKVGFEFQRHGVRVGGEWHPIVKMEWSEATPLVTWVERHLWDAPALGYLAVRFAETLASLRAAGVAHGDLQHGNILVAPGTDLRLIDYDGMFVPALAGRPSAERGHRNYHHPQRAEMAFGPAVDTFPSWVIYASIAALSVDPLLWGRLDGGDECLLFRAADFADPDRSAAFECLEGSGDARLRRLALLLREHLARPAGRIPLLAFPLAVLPATAPHGGEGGVNLEDRKRLYAALRGDSDPGPQDRTRNGGHARAASGGIGHAAGPAAGRTKPPAGAALVEERRPPPAVPAVSFGAAIGRPRGLLAAAGAVIVALLAAGGGGALPPLPAVAFTAAAGAGWYGLARRTYAGLPEVVAAAAAAARLSEAERAAARADREIASLARDRDAADLAARDSDDAHDRAAEDARRGHTAETRAVDDELRNRLADVAARQQALARREKEAVELARLRHRDAALAVALREHRVASARLAEIDHQLIYALALDDVVTAADFVEVVAGAGGDGGKGDQPALLLANGRELRSSRLGPRQASALQAWRRSLEAKVAPDLPAVPPAELDAVAGAFADERAALAAEEDEARQWASARMDAARAEVAAGGEDRVERLRQAQLAAAARRLELDRALGRARKDAAEAAFRLEAARRDAAAYAGVTFAAFLRALAGRT